MQRPFSPSTTNFRFDATPFHPHLVSPSFFHQKLPSNYNALPIKLSKNSISARPKQSVKSLEYLDGEISARPGQNDRTTPNPPTNCADMNTSKYACVAVLLLALTGAATASGNPRSLQPLYPKVNHTWLTCPCFYRWFENSSRKGQRLLDCHFQRKCLRLSRCEWFDLVFRG